MPAIYFDGHKFVMVDRGCHGNYAFYRFKRLSDRRGTRIKVRAASGIGDVRGGAAGFFSRKGDAEEALKIYAEKRGWRRLGELEKQPTAITGFEDPLFRKD